MSARGSQRERRGVRLAIAALVVAALAAPAAASDDRGFELGFGLGILEIDPGLTGPADRSQEPTAGLRAAYQIDDHWGVSFDATYATYSTDTFRGDTNELDGRVAAEFTITPYRDARWFVVAGAGYTRMTFDTAYDFKSAFASVGIGQRIWIAGPAQGRWELRVDQSLAKDGLTNEDLTSQDVTQVRFLVGLSFNLGGGPRYGRRSESSPAPAPAATAPAPAAQPAPQSVPPPPVPEPPPPEPPPDADGDGVPDADDQCPATLKGIRVGADGCPLDEDHDGVYDGLGMDRCLGTPRGAKVDASGCPIDTDGDGVFDGLDRCPDSAPGTQVDADGCP